MLLCIVILFGVADRFVLGIGWPWPEEAARFLLVWLTFLTTATAFRYREHFIVDGLVNLINSAQVRAVIALPVNIAVLAILAVASIKGVEMTLVASSHTSTALGLPMSWVYAAIPIGCALGAFFMVVPNPPQSDQ